MQTLSKWAETLEPGLRKIYIDDLKRHPDYVGMVFNVEKSNKLTETDIDTVDIGYMQEVGEAGATPLEDMEIGYPTTYTNKVYKKGTIITKELDDDGMYGEIKRRMRSLSVTTVNTPNKTAFSVFRNGFNTAFTSYGDNKPLFSTAHPKKKAGGTYSNASSTGAALSETSLETAILNIQEQVDHNGNLIAGGQGNIVLMVPPKLRKTGMVLLGSELLPGSANNDINVYNGVKVDGQSYNITLLVNPWISAAAGGSDTAWYVLSKGEHRLNFFWREPVNMNSTVDWDSDALKFKVRGRWSYGWSGAWGVYGSKGDGQAYAA